MTNPKPYRLGILIGRFQAFHAGHEYMIEKAVALCEQVGVFIGSSQESGTVKNPFPYEVRAEMLGKVFGDRVKICPLPDIGVGNNARWGEHVLETVKQYFGEAPDLLVSGKELRRIEWFDSVAGLRVSELYVPKLIEISATEMRGYFLDNDFEAFKRFTNPVLWDEYDRLRALVLAAQGNEETKSV